MPRNAEERPQTTSLKIENFVALKLQYLFQMTAILETEISQSCSGELISIMLLCKEGGEPLADFSLYKPGTGIIV